ncbi:Riboflavin synthase [Buchnera aphidicola (Tetraneura ulmi)]|uniref:riboflavin synthase subunit alpha n=1 Tax=Buchnera aphidicola TaxID=9 RepID=UPI003464B424
MFTGIIDTIAKVVFFEKKNGILSLTVLVEDLNFFNNLKLGSSISNNGCCLSIVKINGNLIDFQIIEETFNSTNFYSLKINDYLNLEKSKKFSEEIGGHIIYGHVSTTASILKIENCNKNKSIKLVIKNRKFIKYLIEKGSICVDGISLTVGKVKQKSFFIHLIPDTLVRTNIGNRIIGDIVNIEVDYITKVIVDTVLKNKNFFV